MGKILKLTGNNFICFVWYIAALIMCSCNGPETKKYKATTFPAALSEKDKTYFKQQLEKVESKKSDAEFIRITDLERKLVDLYGYEGIKLVIGINDDSKNYQLGKFPVDCPWAPLNEITAAQFIDSNFRSLSQQLPAMIISMKERCHYIYAERSETGWELHYFIDQVLFDGRRSFTIYSGGVPNPAPADSLLPFGWSIPPMLRKFYAIHDGFNDLNGIDILSSREIGVLDPESKENRKPPPGYTFNDLLVVIDYASDYEDCFLRERGQKTSNFMAEWDEDSWIITPKNIDFFSFINESFSHPDEE